MHMHTSSPTLARAHAMLTLTLTLLLTHPHSYPRAAYALIAIPILFGVQVPGFEGEFGNLNSASAVTVEVLNPVYALSDPLEPNNCEIQIS